MAHKIYDNFYLSNEVEDSYDSHLDLQQFCKVDNSLVGEPGMIRRINVYKATAATEKLAMGEGNTKSIEVTFSPKEYKILLAQNRFEYFDEQDMTDPMLVPTGMHQMGVDLFNTVTADIFTEFNAATMIVLTDTLGFDCFADAQAMLNVETLEGLRTFAFVCPADVAELRKNLKESLQYVQAYAFNGYVGSVAGTAIYTKKNSVKGTICFATGDAVTIFNKKGTEVEQDRDPNTRKNTDYSRKYYFTALTDGSKAVKILKGAKATASTDTAVTAGKKYYVAYQLGYIEVVPAEGDKPATKGWFEIK
jgi:hypothetical protein